MRIFINHVNTYSGVALARTLRNTENVLNRLFGTAKGLEEEVGASPDNQLDEKQVPVPSCIRRLISKRNPQQLLQNLLTCSLAVFDLHNTDPDEVEFIFKKLKGAPLRQPLCVVLISSTITWESTRRQYVRDPPDESENSETTTGRGENNSGDERDRTSSPSGREDPNSLRSPESSEVWSPTNGETSGSNSAANELKPQILSGEKFELRVPPKNYERWKMVETLLMSLNSKENFRGIVVSAGLMYGFGEDTLYEPFKAAWLGLQTHKLVGAGNNYVPTVHIQDVCTLVKTLVLDGSKAVGGYHLAVDKAYNTQRQIIESIVGELGNPVDVVGMSGEEAALLETADILSQNLRFECSPLMAASTFQWHAEEGFVKAIKRTASEFCQCRGLRQLKILVTGPPGSGRTSISEQIAKHFNICHVKTADVVENSREGDIDPASSGASGTVPQEEPKKKGKRGPARRVRYDSETMARMFRVKLSENTCRYRGFVLDGFPKSYEDCQSLFLPSTTASAEAADQGDKAPTESEDNPEDTDRKEAELKPDTAIIPDFVIALGASVETCEKRLMSLHPSAVITSHNDRDGFRRRMQIYTQQNESVEGRPKTTDFFQERGIEILTLPTDGKPLEDLFVSSVIYISRFGPIRNFLLESSNWLAEKEQALGSKEALEDQHERERQRCEREEEEQQLQKQRDRDIARLRCISEHEQQLLLARSIPLRRYLMQNVIPALSEGLLEVCRIMPEDPVGYLAAFLFEKARKLQ